MKTTSVVVMFFSESIIPKVLDHSYVQSSLSTFTSNLTTAFERHLTSNLTTAFERHLTTEYFMDIGVDLAPRHLTYYSMLLFLSNKPSNLN